MKHIRFPHYWSGAVAPGLGGFLLVFLAAGCGKDVPDYGQPNGPPPSPPAATSPLTASATPASGDPADVSAPSADPLSSGSDPLTQGTDAATPDPTADPLQGPQMPTKHSHWLNAQMSQARIIVRLNGLRLSSSVPPGTQDVTMKLRPGPNTLTVTYEPRSPHSWGSVTLTEGEHDDAKALSLAEFRQAPMADTSAATGENQEALTPVTQTFTFIAN